MLKRIFLFLAIIMLASCVKVHYKRTPYNSYIGMNESELVARLGPPDNIYKNGKEKFLTYYKTSYARQGYMNGFCKLTFIFYKNQIDTWKYDGNLCDNFADTIGLR